MRNASHTGDRRPIASRRWKFSGLATRWLVARGIAPNCISVAGLLAGLLAGACFAIIPRVPEFERLLWMGGWDAEFIATVSALTAPRRPDELGFV